MADTKISALTAKSPPVDNDAVPIFDSAEALPANQNKKVIWSVIKSTLKTYFDTFYATGIFTLNPAVTTTNYSGESWTGTAGPALAIGDICFMGPDGKFWKAIGNLPAVWQNAHAYTVGTVIKPTANQNFFLFCSAVAGTGTSGGSEPTWAFTLGTTAPGGTIVDNAGSNQVTWTYIDTESCAGRVMATGTIGAGATGVFLKRGFICYASFVDPATSAAYITGQTLYLYQTTSGAFTQVRPIATGNRVQLVGRAAAQANTVFFDPNAVIVQV